MQDRIILLSLSQLFKLPMPPEITATVVSVAGSSITLDVGTGQAHAWVGGVIEFTSGALKDISFAIADNRDENVIVAVHKFTQYFLPIPGDTVTLKPGPLKGNAVEIYVDDPDSIRAALEETTPPRFFVCLNSVESDISFRSLGGYSVSGEGVLSDTYSLDVTVETKYVTGIPNADDVKRVAFELPLLRDQVAVLIFNYVLNAGNRVNLVDGIGIGRALINRPGSKNPTRGYVMSFDLEVL